jgi:hypothetical protein
MTSEFDKKILTWCKLHPDDPLSGYFIESYKQAEEARKEKSKKWKLIDTALRNYESRPQKARHDI